MSYLLDPADLPALGAHLRELGWLAEERPIACAKIGDGNMNLTVRVTTKSGSYVLKQARPWVEKYPHIAAPVERATVEASFYRAVADYSVVAKAMPALLGFDADSNLLLLEDLGAAEDLMNLYSGKAAPGLQLEDLIAQVCAFLRGLHSVEPGEPELFRNRAMRRLNHEHQYDYPLRADNGLNLDGITPGLQAVAGEVQADEAFCAQVRELGEIYLADGDTLLHGDFFPGSWLAGQTIRIIDPEFCFLGPREYDVGVLLAHLELIGARGLWDIVERSQPAGIDWKFARRFAGAEIMRRLIGVAQLPLAAGISQKKAWLDTARELVCAS